MVQSDRKPLLVVITLDSANFSHDLKCLSGKTLSKFTPHCWCPRFDMFITGKQFFVQLSTLSICLVPTFCAMCSSRCAWGPDLYLKWMEDSGLSYALSWGVTSWLLLISPGLHQFPLLNINKWHMFKVQGTQFAGQKKTILLRMFSSISWEGATWYEFYKGEVLLKKNATFGDVMVMLIISPVVSSHPKKKKSTCYF